MTTNHPSLLTLAAAFDAVHTKWMLMPKGQDRDDLVDRLNDLADEIRIAPVIRGPRRRRRPAICCGPSGLLMPVSPPWTMTRHGTSSPPSSLG